MYESKYYTCEEIDQRLLQNYYDDLVASGYTGTKKEYQKLILSIPDKVNLEVGKGLSTNDFTNELKEKLKGLKNITRVSELTNDSNYQDVGEVTYLVENFYTDKFLVPLNLNRYRDFQDFVIKVSIFINDTRSLLGVQDFDKYTKLTKDVEQLIEDIKILKSQPIPGVEVLTESEIENIFKELL